MTIEQSDYAYLLGGIAAGVLAGYAAWKVMDPNAGSPRIAPSSGVSTRVNGLMVRAAGCPSPAGLASAADPAFWGAWFRGHVGEEALARAKALMDQYGHHRAGMMIMQAIGDSLYGANARW